MKKTTSNIYKPRMINFGDIITTNIHLFTPLPNDKKIFNILKTLALKNFGDIQFKTTLLNKTLVPTLNFEEAIDNEAMKHFSINTDCLYSVSDFTKLIFNSYTGKIKRGVFNVYSKKQL